MMSLEYLIIISLFIFYYFLILIFEKRIMTEPEKIISRFLAIVLFYAGVSLIYFSLVGKPLFDATVESYSVYIFIIGFVSILWTIPELLSEFSFFRRFIRKKETKDSKEAKKKK